MKQALTYRIVLPAARRGGGGAGGVGGGARAVQLLGAAQALRENIRAPLSPMDQRKHDSTISNLCGEMDQAAFASVWSAGRAMTLEQVVAYALEGV